MDVYLRNHYCLHFPNILLQIVTHSLGSHKKGELGRACPALRGVLHLTSGKEMIV